MEAIAGLDRTGRTLLGPASDLVELVAPNGLRHTAVVFHPEYLDHNAINDALTVVLGFLESPMVTGLLEMVAHDREKGAFVYPTGQVWSVAEVIRALADVGETAGVRAGLELMYSAGLILSEAAEIGAAAGVYSHGGLTPWRLMLRGDGQVQVIGHALPQVEILAFHEDERRVPREDSFRYCPPERVEAKPEDLTSDLFALALISFELITGKPIYDGLVNDIRQQAARGEGSRRLFRFRELLPDSVREVLSVACKPTPKDRYVNGPDFLDAVRHVLSSPEAKGPSLSEVMERVSRLGSRQGEQLSNSATQALSRDDLKALLEDGPIPAAPPKAWSPPPAREGRAPARARREASDEEPAPSPSPVPAVQELAGSGRWSRAPARGPRSPRGGEGGADPDTSPAALAARSDPADLIARVRASGAREPRRPPSLGPAPAAPVDSGDRLSAEDLLARVRASGEKGADDTWTRRRQAQQADAQEVVASILRPASSSGGSPPAPVPSPEPATKDAADGAPRFQAGRVRRPRRGGSPLELGGPETLDPAQESLSPPRSDPRIEAVKRAEAPSLPETPAPPEAAARAEPPNGAAAPSGRHPAINEVEEPIAPPLAMPRPVKPPPAAPREIPVPDDPADSGARPTPSRPVPMVAGADPWSREPELLHAGDSSGGTETVTIQLAPGGREQRFRLPRAGSVASAIGRLVGPVLPIRVELDGRIAGWYRIDGPEGPLDPWLQMSDLDASLTYTLRLVPNHPLRALILAPAADPPLRLLTQLGSAVPVASLVDHLVAWMGLNGRWQLSAEGRVLEGRAILADLGELPDPLPVTLEPEAAR